MNWPIYIEPPFLGNDLETYNTLGKYKDVNQ